MEPQEESSRGLVIGIIVFVIIIAAIGIYYWKGGKGTSGNGGNTDTTGQVSNEANKISVSAQYPGKTVYVSSVTLDTDGWVVIHKNVNGEAGDIIGKTFFKKGTRPGQIDVTALVDGQSYFAMLHNDDGDSKFDAAKDLPIKDSQGNIVMTKFDVSTNIPEVKG